MTGLTAQAVAQMQSDLEVSERNNESLRTQLGLVTADRDKLRLELSTMRQERDDALMVSTQVRTILEHTSLGLVQGINKLNDQQSQMRITRRKRQEQEFDVEFGRHPTFMRRPEHYEAEKDNSERQSVATERPAPEPARPYVREKETRLLDPRAHRTSPIERTPVALRTDAMPVRPMPGPLPRASEDHPYANDPRMPRVDPMQPGPHDETQEDRDRRNLSAIARQIGVTDDDYTS